MHQEAGPLGDVDQLTSPSLREQARQVIRSSITTGDLAPGQIYTARRIAEQLGVSVTPVREALMDLTNEGMVEIVRNRGFRVPALSEHDLDEIFELRMALEVPGIERLAEIAVQNLNSFEGLAQQIMLAAQKGDLIGFLEFDRQFHLDLLNELGNHRLVQIVRSLRDQTRMYGLPHLAQEGQLVASAAEHEEILNAIEKSDAGLARSCMIRHLEHTRGIWAGRPEDVR